MKRYICTKLFMKTGKTEVAKQAGVELHEVQGVWHCKTLQHHKALFMVIGSKNFWEITYNGDTGEMYIDRYIKEQNTAIQLEIGEA